MSCSSLLQVHSMTCSSILQGHPMSCSSILQGHLMGCSSILQGHPMDCSSSKSVKAVQTLSYVSDSCRSTNNHPNQLKTLYFTKLNIITSLPPYPPIWSHFYIFHHTMTQTPQTMQPFCLAGSHVQPESSNWCMLFGYSVLPY